MASVHKSRTLKILLFGSVPTFETARPNVYPAVRSALDVENIIKELMRAVGNGAKFNNAGSKVISVEAAAASAFHISLDALAALLLTARQLVGIMLSSLKL